MNSVFVTQPTNTSINVARILRAVRIYYGFSQARFARILGVNQAKLSRMERTGENVEVSVWSNLCDYAQINLQCFKTGFVEIGPCSVTLGDRRMFGDFRIPNRYSYTQGSSARLALPYLAKIEKVLGSEFVCSFVRSKGLTPDYFTILNAPINLNFIHDVCELLISRNLASPKSFGNFDYIASPQMHGRFIKGFERSKTLSEFLSSAVRNADRYERNCTWTIENVNDEIYVKWRKNSHYSDFKASSDVTEFMNRYRSEYVKTLPSLLGYKPKSDIVNAELEMGRVCLK